MTACLFASHFGARQIPTALLGLVILWAALLPLSAYATPTTEPADIAALRASEARSATDLRQQAIKLRAASSGRKHRAWAALALAEFENDLEHAEAAIAMLDEAQREADALRLSDLKFWTLSARSTILVNRGRSAETALVLTEMEAMANASGNAEWRAQWLDQRGVLERKLGHFDVSLDFFQQSLLLYRQLKDSVDMARELNSMGVIHGRTGKFSDAVLAHTEALKLSRAVGDRSETARGLRMLGVLYRSIEDEELGTRYLLEALAYVEERNVREAIALHGELSKSLTVLNRMSEAQYHAEQAVKLVKQSGSPPNRVNSYTRMAELKLAMGKVDEADYWTKLGFESFNDVGIRDQTLLLVSQAKVSAARGQSAKALKQTKNALLFVRKIGDRIMERSVLDLLAEQQLKVGDTVEAFATRKEHQALDKELSIDLAARKIAALEGKLERERSDTERTLLERDNAIQALDLSRQRLLGIALIAGLVLLLVVAGSLYWRYLGMKRSQAEIRASRDELSQLHNSLLDSTSTLERVAHTDALTGLANRRALTKKMEQRLALGHEQRRSLSVHLMDLDFFKHINDKYGHLAGDAVLRDVAMRLTASLPVDASVGRWGGEEFIFLVNHASVAEAVAVAEHVRSVIAATPVLFEQYAINVTTSIGIASNHVLDAHSADPLLAAADAALYRAKNLGRNRVQSAES